MFLFVILLNLLAHCLSLGPVPIDTASGVGKDKINDVGDIASGSNPVTTCDDTNPKYNAKKIAETGAGGSSPYWDIGQQALFFIEPLGYHLHKYVPATDTHTKAKLDATLSLGFIVPVEGTTDQFIVGVDLKFLIVRWDGEEGSEIEILETLAEVDQGNRISGGSADSTGRVLAGTETMTALPTSAIFSVDGSVISTIESGTTLGHGLVWGENESAFYYIDAADILKIRRYDYDINTGIIGNKTYVFDGKKSGIIGMLDGLSIDINGNLLVANNGGGAVLQIDPRTGKLLQRIYLPLPVLAVTSVAFGGANLDTMYVTTTKAPTQEHMAASLDVNDSGATFAVTGLGIIGCPMFNFKYNTISTK